MYEQRIETVHHLLGEMGLTQMIVSDPRSIHYLTGAYVEPGERFLALTIVEGKAPVLFLNRLFTAPKSLPCEVFSFDDVDNPLPEVAKLLHAEETCGVDKNLAARFLVPLMEAHAAKSFALGSPAVDGARAIKSVEEQELMRAASATNDQAMIRFRELVHEGAMILCSRQKDVYRVFCYHGAEHKTIFCYEAGLPLTVENVRIQPRHHPRCGTSFLFVVIIVSIIVSSLVFPYINWQSVWVRVGVKLLLLVPVVGITYEFNRMVGAHDNALTRVLSAPGMWLQNFTTHEPDDSMIEVAIEAMKLVIPEEKGTDTW